jgi:hypothetical protein
MFIQNAAPVLKNFPSRSAVSAVTGFSSRDALDPGARHVQRGRDRVRGELKRNEKFLPQDFARMNRRKFLCHLREYTGPHNLDFYHSLSYISPERSIMRVYKLKAFARFQHREGITDRMLGKAIADAERGLIDAELGGGLIKQRTARSGQGKSGGYRTIIAYRRGDRAVFLFGFAKSERANLDDDELIYWRRIGRLYIALDDDVLETAVAADELVEVSYGQEK